MKIFRRIVIGFLVFFATLTIVYFLGPKPPIPVLDGTLPKVESDLAALEREVNRRESSEKDLKPDNQARIVWSNPKQKKKTPYSIVYLHGLTASQAEGDPVHLNIAKRYGCNLYLARLEAHGKDTSDALLNLTPDNLLASAKRAVAIGKVLGEKVILMGTSTGASLAIYIASQNPDLAGVILYSPLIEFYDPSTILLDKPWGLQIAKAIRGDYIERQNQDPNPDFDKYWINKYRIESAITLKTYLSYVMTEENFGKIEQPLFIGYYYKNDNEQDKTVSVNAILNAYPKFGTPESLKTIVAFPKSESHVIASSITSKDVDGVFKETCKFLEEKVRLKPVF